MTLKEGAIPSDATISVQAPSSLPGGYVLDVECDGQVIPVPIPEGGVFEGEVFQTELPLPQPIAPPSSADDIVVIPDDCVIPVPVETPLQSSLSPTPVSTTTKTTVTNPDGTQITTEETVHMDGTVVRKSITQQIGSSINGTDQQSHTHSEITYATVPEGQWRTPLWACCHGGK